MQEVKDSQMIYVVQDSDYRVGRPFTDMKGNTGSITVKTKGLTGILT
jgi:hypothetical protein